MSYVSVTNRLVVLCVQHGTARCPLILSLMGDFTLHRQVAEDESVGINKLKKCALFGGNNVKNVNV
jgi:hypothetical protein